MSLLLESGTIPAGVVIKYWGNIPFMPSVSNKLFISNNSGTIEISLEKLCEAIKKYLLVDEHAYELTDKITVFQEEDWTLVINDEPFVVISAEDFVFMVKYVVTNSNLDSGDLRESLVNELVFGDKQPKNLKSQQELFDWLTKLEIGEGFLQIPEVKGSRRFLWH